MNSFLLVAPAAPRRTAPIRFGLAATLLAVVAPAQIWQQVQPAVRPALRHHHCMAFDAARDVVVLFGGRGLVWPNAPDDTWTWNGVDWLLLQPSMAPPGRGGANMVYDSGRQRIVLFGGHGSDLGPRMLDDTWEWDGFSWLQRTPLHAPAARYDFAMAYDAARACTVLFGGSGLGPLRFGDSWTWDGTDWTQLAPTHSPSARQAPAMTYDSARARCVLFGGHDGQYLADTWQWDGTDWVQHATAHAPSPLAGAALVYDSANQRAVLFGGDISSGGWPFFHDETWEYDGQDWVDQLCLTAPARRYGMSMAYDETRANVVLFGGADTQVFMDDTWLFAHDLAAATFTPFGQGCPGSVGTPQLALAGGLPIVGTTFQVACTNLQLDHFTTMWLGFSSTNWTLGTLPYDLGALGMPGCTLFVSGDLVTMLLNWNGTAFWQTAIPNAPQLVGLPFYLQAGVIDHVNDLGMVVTNAAEVRIGDH